MAVIAVTGLLVFISIPLFSAIKERSRRAHCANNLRQVGKALSMYAGDYRGLLPDCTPNNPRFTGSVWPWDLHTNVTQELDKRGAPRDVMYCPSNPTMNDDFHWNFFRRNPADRSPIRIVGYVFLLNGCVRVPPTMWRKNLLGDGTNGPSQTELVADAVGSTGGDYTNIKGQKQDRTSHLKGTKPAGGNIVFEDGHAQWRDFREMKYRFSTGSTGAIRWDF